MVYNKKVWSCDFSDQYTPSRSLGEESRFNYDVIIVIGTVIWLVGLFPERREKQAQKS